jgi:GDP-L-fucose synthase
MPSPLPYERIFVAGHRGMVGQSVVRLLSSTARNTEVVTRTRDVLDLNDAAATRQFFHDNSLDAVIFAAARVGGIHANNAYPVEFLLENLQTATNTITAAYQSGVKRLLFLGSTCIYPRMAPQPIKEESLLTSPLEPTNEAYALAKIAGLKLCQYYRRQYGVLYHSAMPTNLYGPGDNYHLENSHVLPALIRRCHDAKLEGAESVTIWGTGTPQREFLHVDDLAAALIHLLGLANPPDWVNVGSGQDQTILELAKLVAKVVGFEGKILTDPTKPDGTPRKLTDISLLRSTGWSPTIDLESGLQSTYRDFCTQISQGKLRTA